MTLTDEQRRQLEQWVKHARDDRKTVEVHVPSAELLTSYWEELLNVYRGTDHGDWTVSLEPAGAVKLIYAPSSV